MRTTRLLTVVFGGVYVWGCVSEGSGVCLGGVQGVCVQDVCVSRVVSGGVFPGGGGCPGCVCVQGVYVQGGGRCPGRVVSGGCTPPTSKATHLRPRGTPPPWTEGMTHARENITLRAVKWS